MVGWLIVHMIALVLFRIVSLVTTIVIMTSFFTGASSYDTSALIVGGSLSIGFLVALNWLGYYFWDIVRSAQGDLEQEDGRARAFELGNQNSQQMLYPAQQIIVQVPPTQGFVQPPCQPANALAVFSAPVPSADQTVRIIIGKFIT